ncbi:MAG: DUF1109 domain-containing protein [Massilia sp.]
MKTDDLISMLAAGPDVRPPALPTTRIAATTGVALLVSLLLMMLLLGVRADLDQAMQGGAFWQKVLFVAALAAGGAIASKRLAIPGASTARAAMLVAAPVVLMWAFAALVLAGAAPEQRMSLFLGSTWRVCPWLIGALSLPIFGALLHAMRALAPTRLRWAGAAAGFTAGALAAVIYCLHCPEVAAPFVAFWYLVGVLLPAALGALIGPRVLAW